jgi:hypothetical protein
LLIQTERPTRQSSSAADAILPAGRWQLFVILLAGPKRSVRVLAVSFTCLIEAPDQRRAGARQTRVSFVQLRCVGSITGRGADWRMLEERRCGNQASACSLQLAWLPTKGFVMMESAFVRLEGIDGPFTISSELFGSIKMQRDMEVIRKILQAVQNKKDLKMEFLKVDGLDDFTVGYHVARCFTGPVTSTVRQRIRMAFLTSTSW